MDELHMAGMGAAEGHWQDESIRGDRIKWHHVNRLDSDPIASAISDMSRVLGNLQDRIAPKHEFFTKAIQIAHYPANGARYAEHSDVSPLVPTRRLTFILYLRDTPETATSGGHLRVRTLNGQSVDIEPRMNRLVIFRSELQHQVLPTYFDRYAITLWAHNYDTLVDQDFLRTSTLPTIFVSVGSYRDPDTCNTIVNLFERAAYPERISVGVIYYENDGQEYIGMDDIPQKYASRIRSIGLPARSAMGPIVTRAEIQSTLLGNQDYYMQIDSHMRFAQNWDKILLNNLSMCPNPQKSVLSTYPPSIMDDILVPVSGPILLRPTHFDADSMLRITGVVVSPPESQVPLQHMFVAAGFLFAPSPIVQDCPYDKSLQFLFFGEEIILSLRLWAKGWNIYSPWNPDGYGPVCWHNWDRSHRRTFWQDWGNSDEARKKRAESLKKIRDWQTGARPLFDQYGNANERSLSSFEEAAGVNFKLQTIVEGDQ